MPATIMLCSEIWALQILGIFAGWISVNDQAVNAILVTLFAILFMGFISVGLFKSFEYYNRHLLDQGTDPSAQEYNVPLWGEVVRQVLRGTLLMLALSVAPFFLINIVTHHDAKRDYVYISVVKANSSHIIQV